MHHRRSSGTPRLSRKNPVVKARLLLEPLEARNLLSNVIVNKTAEDTSSQDTQSETSIVLSQNGTIITGFNDSEENVGGVNHFTGWATSTSASGGASFTDQGALPSSTAGDAGDPSLAANSSNGNVYFSTLGFSSSNVIQFFKSTNNGTSFSAPVNAAPGFSSSNVLDKDWTTVDNFTGTGNGNIYTTYNDFTNFGFTDNGIFLSRSTNSGSSFTKIGKITTSGNNVEGSNVVVGKDHAVYIFWWDANSSSEQIKVRKSTNQGLTFGSITTVATLKTTGSDGDLGLTTGTAGPTPNLSFRTNAFPLAAVNPTNSQNLYVVYNDVGQASGDKADIFFTQSSNGGTTWTTPIKINNDTTTTDQWQPALAVTPDGTHIFITWYDRRNDSTNSLIDRYGVIGSISGSTVTFGSNFKITEADAGATTTSFPAVVGQDPAINSTYMGDYDVATADNSFFYTTWGDNRLSDAAHTNNPDVRFEKITTSGSIVFSPIGSAVRSEFGVPPDSFSGNDGTGAGRLSAAANSSGDAGGFMAGSLTGQLPAAPAPTATTPPLLNTTSTDHFFAAIGGQGAGAAVATPSPTQLSGGTDTPAPQNGLGDGLGNPLPPL
jgi:hypothetical protein